MTMLSTEFDFVPAKAIFVRRDERQRRTISTAGLAESIRQCGLMNPLIIDRDLVLIAGERRLQACLELGLHEVPVRYIEALNERERQLLELEENIKRSDLAWQDLVRACQRIHALYVEASPGWTLEKTAEVCAINKSTVSMYLKVAAQLDDERVNAAKSSREAYNLISRRDSRAAGEALQDLLDAGGNAGGDLYDRDDEAIPAGIPRDALVASPTNAPAASPLQRQIETRIPTPVAKPAGASRPTPAEIIQTTSFLEWAPSYTGQKFNLIHCDFPYGIGVFDGAMGRSEVDRTYDDSPDAYWELIKCFCTNLDKFCSLSAHVMFWFSEKHRDKTLAMFAELAPSIKWFDYPLIWVKSDNAGSIGSYRHQPRHVYETCLLGARSSRQISRMVGDAYSCPTDKRFHPSTKPEPMLKHFFTMLVDEHTRLLDPTCGGGSAIRAAEAMRAERVLGLEIDPAAAGEARRALSQSRALAAGSNRLADL